MSIGFLPASFPSLGMRCDGLKNGYAGIAPSGRRAHVRFGDRRGRGIGSIVIAGIRRNPHARASDIT
ncbi:hypothetical protein LDP08_21125 [Ralstonia pseudosolanacearum]|uniref:hypothetical protein n=1 Tax=Ralstonia pseudosolanacearum TaxID=1310165 RepID=UPI003CF289C4